MSVFQNYFDPGLSAAVHPLVCLLNPKVDTPPLAATDVLRTTAIPLSPREKILAFNRVFNGVA